jgi:tricorn protease
VPAGPPPPPAEPKDEPLKIDTRRIELRGEAITGMAGNAASPKFDPTGKYLIFAMSPVGSMAGEMDGPPATTWWSMTLEERQFNQLTQSPGNLDPQFAPDGSKLYLRNEQSKSLGFVALQGPAAVGGGPVATVAPVSLDQYQIWDQMLYEGWRHLRDTFYRAPSDLGVDWDAVLARYRPRVQFVGTTAEFNNLYREMLGELGGSHLGFYGGGPTSEAPPENTADFGVWFDEGFAGPGWKVARVITDGPADLPGSRLYVGDVITELAGQALDAGSNRERVLRNLAGKPVRLTVESGPAALAALKAEVAADAPAPGATREVVIKPASWNGMRQRVYEQWVADNRATVEQLSGGKVGYLHIQGMNQPSLEKFRRELFAMNLDKPGLIIDVRFNGGGNIHEQLFDILDQRVFGTQGHRGGVAVRQPALSYPGKIVVLINPHSYSDAEIFPHIMQEMGLAKLVGEATGGNVIGTYDFPLLDGSMLRLPSWGWWLNNGTDMEGNGARPDIEVIFDPQQGAAGVDNQLAAAVQALQ